MNEPKSDARTAKGLYHPSVDEAGCSEPIWSAGNDEIRGHHEDFIGPSFIAGSWFEAFAQGAPATNASLIGNYVVTGTETNGKKYDGPGPLAVTMEKNGALGRYVGIGQVVGNKLIVASSAEGRTVIGIMDIKGDGSLEGKYWRRTDPGTGGTEVWKKK